MKKEKKIEILLNHIHLLQTENEKLKEENRRLHHIDEIQCLEEKKTDYDKLIHECMEIRKTYIESMNQIHLLMADYKKDIGKIKPRRTSKKSKTIF